MVLVFELCSNFIIVNNRKIYNWALIAFVMGLKDTLMGIILASGIVVGAGCANAKPWGKTSGYYDSRGMPTASLTGGATDLPLGTQTFGFIDVATDKKELDNVQDPYMEISLAKKVILEGFGEGVGKVFEKSVGPIVEYNRDFAQPRGITRLGLVFEPDVSQFADDTLVGINLYPVATEDAGSQIVLYGSKQFNKGNWYIEGFFDYNTTPKKVVSEVQLGKRIWGNLNAVVEARHNGFLDEQYGVGIGLEFLLK